MRKFPRISPPGGMLDSNRLKARAVSGNASRGTRSTLEMDSRGILAHLGPPMFYRWPSPVWERCFRYCPTGRARSTVSAQPLGPVSAKVRTDGFFLKLITPKYYIK